MPENNTAESPRSGTSVEEFPNEESAEQDEPQLHDVEGNLMTSRLTYHSTESIYDEFNSETGKAHNVEEMVGAVSVSMTTKLLKALQKKPISKVKSTPAFLNQISEERESDLDDSPRASPRLRRPSRRPLNVIKADHRGRRPSPASSSCGRRSSSVSSSSEDDGDLDKKMRRLSTERCRRSPKRRSDDEGDGDDGEGGSTSSRGVARKKMMSENSQSRSGGTNENPGNKSDVQGKCENMGFFCTALNDKLVQVNLKLDETLKSGVEQKKPVEYPILDTRDGSGIEKTEECSGINSKNHEGSRNDSLNDGESLPRTVTNDDDEHVNEIMKDGIMKLSERSNCVDDGGTNENASDKENMNYSTNAETLMDCSESNSCGGCDIPKVVFRGSDVDEIEMYMKAKDTGLELESVAVRTIYHNRKVSRVTSNCCHII